MSNESKFELSVSRYIDAPVDKVWTVLTERLAEWWCPKPWKTEINQLEWHSGGSFDTTMRGPEADQVVAVQGVVLEVVPGKRFVFTDAFKAGWVPQEAFMVGCFEIEPEASGTRYTASARHWSEDSLQKHKEMGFHEGWSAVADQLAALAESKE